jgi:transglutaminase-like putative cysteine protease
MKFSLVHKFSAYVLALLGLVAFGGGGELPIASVLLIAVGVAASWFAEGEILQNERYHRVWNVAIVLAFAAQVARYTFAGAELLNVVVEFASLLQVMKLATRRSARDYQQITVLALLQLIAATVLGGGLSYAVCFLGFVIATPWAMTLGHLRREIEGNYLADARAGRAGVPIDVARILRSRRVVGPGLLVGSSLLAVPIFLLTAVIFVLFPRVGLGILTVRGRGDTAVAGFGTTVDLRGHGTIRNDPTIVLRVEPLVLEESPPPLRTFRLRGATFDRYNGRGWSRSDAHRNEVVRVERAGNHYTLARLPHLGVDQGYRITLDPLDPPVLPVLEGSVGLQIDPRFQAGMTRYTELTLDRDDGVRYPPGDESGLTYTAYVGNAHRTLSAARRVFYEREERFRQRYLQLPDDVPQRVRDLARQIVGAESTPLGKARVMERYLSSRYRYTLELESGRARNPLDDFLFRTRAGHCEYFSTAMAVMLRTVEVPTRNVTGFLGGTYNRYGRFYEVHQGDSHSWVEVWDDARGWVTFDPTPSVGEMMLLRRGVLSELDAMLEAARVRWRRYIVDFDLKDQGRMAQEVWQFWVRHRGQRSATNATRSMRIRGTIGPLPMKQTFAGVVIVAVIAAIGWQLRAWRSADNVTRSTPRTPAIRAAQELARALDEALASRGTSRPASVSLLAFAQALERRGDPFAALALRVASRYMAARFGDESLSLRELEALRTELKQHPTVNTR